MKTNNSFFGPNRLVFQGPVEAPQPDAWAELKKLDFSDKANRENLYKDVEAQLKQMDPKDPKAKPLKDFLGLAKASHEKDAKAAEYWSNRLYTRLMTLPAKGPRGEANIGPVTYAGAEGTTTFNVPQPKAQAKKEAPAPAARPAVAAAPKATAPAAPAPAVDSQADVRQELAQMRQMDRGPYLTAFPEDIGYNEEQALKRIIDQSKEGDYPLNRELAGQKYQISREMKGPTAHYTIKRV